MQTQIRYESEEVGCLKYISMYPGGSIHPGSIHPMWEESILTWGLHPAYNEPEAIIALQKNHAFITLAGIISAGSEPEPGVDEDGEYYPVTHFTSAAKDAAVKMAAFLAAHPAAN
jgi:hypothetical protein